MPRRIHCFGCRSAKSMKPQRSRPITATRFVTSAPASKTLGLLQGLSRDRQSMLRARTRKLLFNGNNYSVDIDLGHGTSISTSDPHRQHHESTDEAKIHVQDFASVGSGKHGASRHYASGTTTPGKNVLSWATMTSRKPITDGFLNPHEDRFVLPKNQFPEILTKHRQ